MSSVTQEKGVSRTAAVEASAESILTAQRSHSAVSVPVSRLAALTDRLLFAALLLVVAMSPFEAGYPPLTRFFRATFTNLELALIALAGVWLLRMLVEPSARARFGRLPLLLPVVALVAAAVISYLFAEYRGQGINFIYRLLMGAVVLISSWEALRTARRLLFTLGTLVAAGLVSAVLGLLEYAPWINIEHWLKVFKPMPTTVGGALRLSGSFEYANGAAMYFEMALPVLLGIATLFTSRGLLESVEGLHISTGGRRALRIALFASIGVFTLALLLTFSRAALAGLAVALLGFGLAGAARRRSAGGVQVSGVVFRSVGGAVVVMVLGAAYIFVTQPVFRLRLTTENDRNWYNVIYEAGTVPALAAGDVVTVPVTIRNDGPMLWRASGALSVRLAYHWKSEDKKQILVFEGRRTLLPHDVEPGESVTVDATLAAPPRVGTYYLEWDMVQENYAWFSAKTGRGSEMTRHVISEPAPGSATRRRTPASMPAPLSADSVLKSDQATVQRTQLWKVAFKMFQAHPITGVGPDAFRNLYGPYAGEKEWNRNIYTNNTYIEMFTNLGILGGLAFLWLGGLALWLAIRNVLREPLDGKWALGLGATAGITAFFFHGLGDYFLFTTPLYIVFWLLLAISALWPRMIRAS